MMCILSQRMCVLFENVRLLVEKICPTQFAVGAVTPPPPSPRAARGAPRASSALSSVAL